MRRTSRFFKMVLKYLKMILILTGPNHTFFVILTINRKKFLKVRATPREMRYS